VTLTGTPGNLDKFDLEWNESLGCQTGLRRLLYIRTHGYGEFINGCAGGGPNFGVQLMPINGVKQSWIAFGETSSLLFTSIALTTNQPSKTGPSLPTRNANTQVQFVFWSEAATNACLAALQPQSGTIITDLTSSTSSEQDYAVNFNFLPTSSDTATSVNVPCNQISSIILSIVEPGPQVDIFSIYFANYTDCWGALRGMAQTRHEGGDISLDICNVRLGLGSAWRYTLSRSDGKPVLAWASMDQAGPGRSVGVVSITHEKGGPRTMKQLDRQHQHITTPGGGTH